MVKFRNNRIFFSAIHARFIRKKLKHLSANL